jgi:tRNA-specific 2-thiouridylase
MPENPIAVAMSGGVDSSVVAALLARRGGPVVGLTMQLWNQRRLPELATEEATGRCCSLDDVYDARRVAEQVGIPYYVVNFERQFEDQVVKPFVEEYLAGRSRSQPATTRVYVMTRPPDATSCCGRWTTRRTKRTSFSD